MDKFSWINGYIHTQAQMLSDRTHDFFLDYPMFGNFLHEIVLALAFSGLLALAGLNFISAAAKIRSFLQGRASFDKCARQLAFLALLLGWALLTGGRIWLYLSGKSTQDNGGPADFILEMSWLLLSIGVLLESIYFILWRLLRNMPVLLCTLGVISAIQNCFALFAIMLSFRFLKAASLPDFAQIGLGDIMPFSFYSPFWNAAIYTFPLIFALGAAYASMWLLLRRGKDDFGRDYYNTMLVWCSTWARNAWLVLWLAYLGFMCRDFFILHQKEMLTRDILMHDGFLLFLWLSPLILWSMVCKSKIALRHKLNLIASFIIACVFTLPLAQQVCAF